MMDFSRSRWDIVGNSKTWFIITAITMVIALAGIIKNTVMTGFPLVLGIDFTGGSIIQLEFDNWDQSKSIPDFAESVKLLVSNYSERAPEVLTTELAPEDTVAGTPGLMIQIRSDAGLIENLDAQTDLYAEIRAIGGDFTVIEETQVGAVMGSELALKALQGVFIGLILILIYVSIRVSFDFAVCAILALFHDLIFLVGIYALFGIEVNSPFVAVLLTVVGYSINDTIVIYDRIRENFKVKRHLPFDRLVNVSLLETMARSINTGAATVLSIITLLIFGGISLRTFMMGLGIGIAVGTYSSIFVAPILLVAWRFRGKGSVVIDEPRPDATRIIRQDDEDDDLIDLAGEDEEAQEVIRIDKGPQAATAKRAKPKRRRRR